MKKFVSIALLSALVFCGTTFVLDPLEPMGAQDPAEPMSSVIAKNAIGNVRVINETAMSVIGNLRAPSENV